jgi:hypothetical protein
MKPTEILIESGVDGTSSQMYKLATSLFEAKVNSDSPSPKLAMNLFRLINSKYERIDVNEINRSMGDVTKLSFFSDLESSIKAIEKYLGSFNIKSKYNKIIDDSFKFLKNNKKRFQDAHKAKNSFLNFMYTATIINLVDMVNIMISSIMRNLSEAVNIDKYIESIDSYKTRFKQAETLFSENAGDLGKLMNAKVNLMETMSPFSDEYEMLMESSLNFYLEVLQLGMAKLLFIILGFLRFTIYSYFYIKESIAYKTDRLKKFLTYLDSKDMAQNEKLAGELDVEAKEIAMRTISGDAEVYKDTSSEQIQANTLL